MAGEKLRLALSILCDQVLKFETTKFLLTTKPHAESGHEWIARHGACNTFHHVLVS